MRIPAQLLWERLLLAIMGGIFCGLLSWQQWTEPLDRVIYDTFNQLNALPVAPDIVIVAVDEASLRELGRWPWPRENHVELMRQLHAVRVDAIALDVIFAERYQNYPQVDQLLAEAFAELGSVVLPVFIGQDGPGGALREILPAEPLASSAAALGHVHVGVDNDGVARSIYLMEGLGGAHWPHITVALARVSGIDLVELPGIVDAEVLSAPRPGLITRSHANLIPFMGPAGTVPQISYVDVMKGRVQHELLAGKIVFVGATAAGHMDNITTSLGQISGVELNANIFEALRRGQLARPVNRQLTSLLSFFVIALTIIGFTRLVPGRLLLAVLTCAALIPLCAFLTLKITHRWISPAPMVLTLLFAYPLWNWLRLAATVDFIQAHLKRLEKENRQWSFRKSLGMTPEGPTGDPVDAIMLQLDAAYIENRESHQLIGRTLEQLSSGVVLAETSGEVLLANDEARELLQMSGEPESISELFAHLDLRECSSVDDLLKDLHNPGCHFSSEGITRPGDRHVLFQAVSIGLDRPLLLFNLTDITELKRSENRRAEALNFLSHDLRAPLTSVLALIEGSRGSRSGRVGDELLLEIERYIRANLSYAENFIQIAKLETANVARADYCEAQSLLDNAVSQLYHMAAARDISLVLEENEEELWLTCSRDLVERAIINLIDNAVKHSPDGSSIDIHVARMDHYLVFTVADRGHGIASNELERIFRGFEQGASARSGVGLGLRFVSAVAEAHQGSIDAGNNPLGGCTFTLRIPQRLD